MKLQPLDHPVASFGSKASKGGGPMGVQVIEHHPDLLRFRVGVRQQEDLKGRSLPWYDCPVTATCIQLANWLARWWNKFGWERWYSASAAPAVPPERGCLGWEPAYSATKLLGGLDRTERTCLVVRVGHFGVGGPRRRDGPPDEARTSERNADLAGQMHHSFFRQRVEFVFFKYGENQLLTPVCLETVRWCGFNWRASNRCVLGWPFLKQRRSTTGHQGVGQRCQPIAGRFTGYPGRQAWSCSW